MKVLTRHVLFSLLGPFLFCFIAFSSLLLTADLFSSLDDFIQNKAPVAWILDYYKAFVPGLLTLVVPMTILFSSLYTLLRMSRNAELTAMQACGVPLWHIYVPFVLLAVLCTAVLYVVNLGPGGNAKARRQAVIERIRGNLDWENIKHGEVYQDHVSGRVWYLQSLNLHRRAAEGIEVLQADAAGNDQAKFFASKGQWKDGSWTLTNVREIQFDTSGNVTREQTIDELPCPTWTEKPIDMVAFQIKPDQLSYRELKGITERLDWQSEVVLAPYRTQILTLWTAPLSVLVFMLFALVDGTSHYRKNASVGVFSAIFILVIFYLVLYTFQAMGRGDRLSPLVATTTPLILFSLIAMIRLAPKFGIYPFAFFRWR